MKIGIKTGIKNGWQADLQASNADFCEIWFHTNKVAAYNQLFAYLKANKISSGLHFWGTLGNRVMANLAYPDSQILHQSHQLVMKTIDVAAENACIYVNVHPGGSMIYKVDFKQEQYSALSKPASISDCNQALYTSLSQLAAYAKKRNVMLIVESVPRLALGHPWYGKKGRLKPIDLGELPITSIEPTLGIDNLYFANDFGHTAGNLITDDRNKIIDYVKKITHKLAAKTKLLHVSYIIPPYNGTDYHGSLKMAEFDSKMAIPNKSEMLQLLKIFVSKDVCALVEPKNDHVGNFFALKSLVDKVS